MRKITADCSCPWPASSRRRRRGPARPLGLDRQLRRRPTPGSGEPRQLPEAPWGVRLPSGGAGSRTRRSSRPFPARRKPSVGNNHVSPVPRPVGLDVSSSASDLTNLGSRPFEDSSTGGERTQTGAEKVVLGEHGPGTPANDRGPRSSASNCEVNATAPRGTTHSGNVQLEMLLRALPLRRRIANVWILRRPGMRSEAPTGDSTGRGRLLSEMVVVRAHPSGGSTFSAV